MSTAAIEITEADLHEPSGQLRFKANVEVALDTIVEYQGARYVVKGVVGGTDPRDNVYVGYPATAIDEQRDRALDRDRILAQLAVLLQAAQGFDDNTLSLPAQRAAIAATIRTVVRLARLELYQAAT